MFKNANGLVEEKIREQEGSNGKTPGEFAGIKIKGQNRWITVIQNAKFSSMKN